MDGTIDNLKQQCDLTEKMLGLKQWIQGTTLTENAVADVVKRRFNNFVRPNNLSLVAIDPNEKFQASHETKDLVLKTIRSKQKKLHLRGVSKTQKCSFN